MQTTPAAPDLPGISASRLTKRMAIGMGAAGLVISVPVALLDVASVVQSAGHLPWPVFQWAFTSPVGVLVLMAVSILLVAPPLVLLLPARGFKRMLARSQDVTGLPIEAWPQRSTADAECTAVERWLGRERRQQLVNLVLLVLLALLVLAFLAIFLAALVYSLSASVNVRCDGQRCPPDFPVRPIALVSIVGACALSVWAGYRWLRRLEASTGIWLRYRDWRSRGPLYYVRQPGVTPEAARTALARYVPAETTVLARLVPVAVLALAPSVLMVSAAIFLDTWLQRQWIPR
jgi:hypothetical protein